MKEFILIGLGLSFPLLIALAILKTMRGSSEEPIEIDKKALADAERSLRESDETDWVVLKRCHGPAYNHAAMTEIVSALNAAGVLATYDVVSSSSAEGGVTNYMLKVERGSETAAEEVLTRRN